MDEVILRVGFKIIAARELMQGGIDFLKIPRVSAITAAPTKPLSTRPKGQKTIRFNSPNS